MCRRRSSNMGRLSCLPFFSLVPLIVKLASIPPELRMRSDIQQRKNDSPGSGRAKLAGPNGPNNGAIKLPDR